MVKNDKDILKPCVLKAGLCMNTGSNPVNGNIKAES